MSPEETALFHQAKDLYNAGQRQQAYLQFCSLYLANREDTSLLCWIGYSTPNRDEAQRALADVERLKPNHPSLPKLRDRVKKLPPPQPVSNTSAAVTDQDKAHKDTSTEGPTAQASVESPPTRQWRKVGDQQWQSVLIPLKIEGTREVAFIFAKYQNQFRCANCGKSLSETAYLSYRLVPQVTHERYCVEHSPVPLEIQGTPTLAEHIVALFQHVAVIGQRLAALEERVAELEAQKGNDQDGTGEQKSEQ